MSAPEIQFEVTSPQRWDRIQVLLRLAVLALLAQLHASAGWIFLAFYWALPVVAAISIQHQGASEYPTQNGQSVLRVLHWWNALLAYMLCLSDRFPTREADLSAVRFEVAPSGNASFGQALLRLLTSLPELIVVVVLGWLAFVGGLVAAVSVLLVEQVPGVILRYLRFYVALQARWLVYHSSLVASHPLITAARWEPR